MKIPDTFSYFVRSFVRSFVRFFSPNSKILLLYMRHLLTEEALVRESRDGNTLTFAPTKTEVVGRGGMGGLHLPAGAFEEPPMGGQIRSAVKGLQHGLQLQGGTSRGRASPQQHLEVRVRRRGPIGGGSNSNRRPPRGRSPGTLSFATTPTPRQGRGAKPGATGGSTTRRGRSKDRLESELSVIRANSPSPE